MSVVKFFLTILPCYGQILSSATHTLSHPELVHGKLGEAGLQEHSGGHAVRMPLAGPQVGGKGNVTLPGHSQPFQEDVTRSTG